MKELTHKKLLKVLAKANIKPASGKIRKGDLKKIYWNLCMADITPTRMNHKITTVFENYPFMDNENRKYLLKMKRYILNRFCRVSNQFIERKTVENQNPGDQYNRLKFVFFKCSKSILDSFYKDVDKFMNKVSTLDELSWRSREPMDGYILGLGCLKLDDEEK